MVGTATGVFASRIAVDAGRSRTRACLDIGWGLVCFHDPTLPYELNRGQANMTYSLKFCALHLVQVIDQGRVTISARSLPQRQQRGLASLRAPRP